jgi:(1->4)-alpha-D-glucan 1-alpha-D-glucosylmutase
MAKGIEDTVFYTYNRLVALNEVGGDPSRFGTSLEEFHRACAQAAEQRPQAMISTSTHDTKRSEDVRARLALLSEVPGEWARAVGRWSQMNGRHRTGEWPDRNAEYLLYQTLVGAHPLPAERALAYMEKASKEAKAHTSWIDPNPDYDRALGGFVEGCLADPEFIADLDAFVRPLVMAGWMTSLSMKLLALTAPGVPDLYQGSELWDLSLVDPDNRRPVDFERRSRLLEESAAMGVEEAWQRLDEGLPKMLLVSRALALRRRRPELFARGSYEPLRVRGEKAGHLVAFIREGSCVTLAPRLVIGLAGGWRDTTVQLPIGHWRDQLSGREVEGGEVAVDHVLESFPVALLTR